MQIDKKLVFLFSYIIIFFSACHSISINEKLDNIDVLIEQNEYVEARRHCTDLYDQINKTIGNVSVESLCRLALDYVILADAEPSKTYDHDITLATLLYGKALELSADSVLSFTYYNTLDSDKSAAYELLYQLCNSENLEFTIEEEHIFEYPDSI